MLNTRNSQEFPSSDKGYLQNKILMANKTWKNIDHLIPQEWQEGKMATTTSSIQSSTLKVLTNSKTKIFKEKDSNITSKTLFRDDVIVFLEISK